MKKINKNKGVSTKAIFAIGAGATALAAASYYLFGPKGKEHQEQLKGWAFKAKGEILEKIEKAKEMSEPVYHEIVDTVTNAYMNKGKIAKKEADAFAKNLKGQWKSIVKSVKPKKINKKV